jgi:hypothetical protein
MRMRTNISAGLKASVQECFYTWILCLVCLAVCPAAALAQDAKPAITAPLNERVLLPNKNCVFHDVTQGDMIIPCGKGPGGKFFDCFGAEGGSIIGELSLSDSKAEPAYRATVGYDLATGLGSVDATNLFDAWPKN